MPVYATVFAFAMLSSAGLPLLNGFIGEFTILQGAFEANRVWAACAVLGVIFGAAYLLWMYQRTVLGQVTNPKNLGLPDLSLRELATFLPLIAWAIWIGVYPKPFFDVLEKPVAQIVERVRPGYFADSHQAVAGRQPSAVSLQPEAAISRQPSAVSHQPSGRRAPGDERRATSDEPRATGDERRAPGDKRRATGDEPRAALAPLAEAVR
jgi:NADH-quinone oxidoreductase subunit M